MNPIALKIVTPQEIILNQEALMVTLPGFEGQRGLLSDHIPIIAQMDPGIIRIYENGTSVSRALFCHGGFFKFTSSNELVVLANEISALDELSETEARQSLAEWEGKILTTDVPEELEKIFAKVKLYRIILESSARS